MHSERPTRRAQPKLLDRVRARLRMKHYSLRTEDAYVGWIRRYIHHHGVRHPDEMGSAEVVEFLSEIAVAGRVSASTQNQALAALLFLYRDVLGRDLEGLEAAVRARGARRLPVVLTSNEVAGVLRQLEGDATLWLIVSLLYGSGLRLLECLRLRVKDVDFERRQLTVREGKGNRDRAALLPRAAEAALRDQLAASRALYDADRPRAHPASSCHLRWRESTRKRESSGRGNGCSLRRASRSIRAAACAAAITCTSPRPSAPSVPQRTGPAFRSE